MVNKLQTQLTTQSGKALWQLALYAKPVTVLELMTALPPSTCQSTVSRALRRMRAKGIVSSHRNGGRYVFWSLPSSQPAKVQVSNQSSKGSSRRNTVCRPDNMPTLCAAIDSAVASHVLLKKEFSAYDITKSIREELAAGGITIDTVETGTVYVNGNSIAKIDHEVVKEVVHDLFQRGEIDGYSRSHNGTNWDYAVTPDDPPDLDDADDDDSANPTTSTPGTSYDGSSSI